MADASEDILITPAENRPGDADDGDEAAEEIADFLTFTKKVGRKIPSRGEKDFEYHGTQLQVNTLDASREAMHNVLAEERFHGPDASRAVWDPTEQGAWLWKGNAKWTHSVGKMRWVPGTAGSPLAKHPKGIQRVYLLPEEVLWALGRGSLDLRWPAEDGEDEENGVPMALQAAHAAILGRAMPDGLTIEKLTVYEHLRRAGYCVLRASDNFHNVPQPDPSMQDASSPGCSSVLEPTGLLSVFSNIFLSKPAPRMPGAALVSPGIYRDYAQVFRALRTIPYQDPIHSTKVLSSSDTLSMTYHVYKPSSSFRKSAPGPPDYYICVLDARNVKIPTDRELHDLLLQTPYLAQNPDPGVNTNVYRKIREGTRNVLLAVVDNGIASFIKFADSGFGNHALYDQKPFAGPRKTSVRKFKPRHRQGGRP